MIHHIYNFIYKNIYRWFIYTMCHDTRQWRMGYTMADYDHYDAFRPAARFLSANSLNKYKFFSFLTYLANINKNNDTPRYAVAVYIQTLNDSGFRNQNSCGFFFSGFAYSMLMPSVMNGVVKSTAFRRSKVIVRSHIARSARCIVPYIEKK